MLDNFQNILIFVFGGGFIATITFFLTAKFIKRKAEAETKTLEAKSKSEEEVVQTQKLDNFESWQAIYKTMFDDLKEVYAQKAHLQDEKINFQNKKLEFFEKKMLAYEEGVSLAYNCANSENCPVIGKLRDVKVRDHKS